MRESFEWKGRKFSLLQGEMLIKQVPYDEFKEQYNSRLKEIMSQVNVGDIVKERIIKEQRLSDLIANIYPEGAKDNPTFLESVIHNLSLLNNYLKMNQAIAENHPENFVYFVDLENDKIGYQTIERMPKI